uniref:Uncharacterized protein n=1 Tax=Cacopsylla melanoneura TaxID=428564 RepID=A0A8D8S2P0_9HEMI
MMLKKVLKQILLKRGHKRLMLNMGLKSKVLKMGLKRMMLKWGLKKMMLKRMILKIELKRMMMKMGVRSRMMTNPLKMLVSLLSRILGEKFMRMLSMHVAVLVVILVGQDTDGVRLNILSRDKKSELCFVSNRRFTLKSPQTTRYL